MQRRKFLGAAAALSSLALPTATATEADDGQIPFEVMYPSSELVQSAHTDLINENRDSTDAIPKLERALAELRAAAEEGR